MWSWDQRLFDEVWLSLPAEQAADARHLLDHGESALAFDTAVGYLYGLHVPITPSLRQRLAQSSSRPDEALLHLRFCPDVDQRRWRVGEDTWEGLEFEERLPGRGDVAWLACNRCPEALFRFASVAASMGRVPYRCGIRDAAGVITVFTTSDDALDHLERCWS